MVKKILLPVIFILLFGFLQTNQVFADVFPSNGLVGYWKFDDLSNGSARDSLGNNPVNLSGTTSINGKINQGRNFNGASDYATIAYNSGPLFNLSTQFSYSAWINPGTNANATIGLPVIGRMQCNTAWPSAEFYLVKNGSGFDLNLYLGSANNNSYSTFSASNSVTPNQWSLVTATYNQAQGAVNLYVNGHKVASGGYNQTIWNPNTPFFLGGTPAPLSTPNCWSAFSQMAMDEVGIWNRALSDNEILSLYNSTTGYVPASMLELYISPNGSDADPGTLNQPLKTISRAQEIVRTKNQNMTGDIIVYLRQGYYPLSAPLSFTTVDSGTNGFNVIYKNYPNEVPLISGGKQITGWIQEGNKWKASVGNLQTRQLYVNGQRAQRARSAGGLPGAQKNSTGYTTTDLSMQNWQNIQDVEIVDHKSWKNYHCGIQNISGGNITVKQPCWANAQAQGGWYSADNPKWIENAYELLDQPGEWYLNRSTGWLYYIPRPGEDMAKATVIAPVLENLISGNNVNNLTFYGLVFAYATWLGPNSNYGFVGMDADYYYTDNLAVNLAPGNLSFKYSKNIRFERNIFTHLGSLGLLFETGNDTVFITGNHFFDISGSAIVATPVNILPVPINIFIANNYIHDIGAEYKGGVGLLSCAHNASIAHNEMLNLPYNGIQVGCNPATINNNSVLNNYIHDFLQFGDDGGGIHVNGAQPGAIISGNVLKNGGWPGGIYLDDGSQYFTVSNNVVFNTSWSARIKGSDNSFYNNYYQSDRPIKTYEATGTINEYNNHPINNFTDAPASIINNAGLESAYQNIKTLPAFPAPSHTINMDDYNLLINSGHINIFDFNNLISNFGK